MSEQPGGIPAQHQPHPLPDGMSWIVGSAPNLVFIQIIDATGTRFLFFSPDDAAVLVRQVTEQLHQARTGLIVTGQPLPKLNGDGA